MILWISPSLHSSQQNPTTRAPATKKNRYMTSRSGKQESNLAKNTKNTVLPKKKLFIISSRHDHLHCTAIFCVFLETITSVETLRHDPFARRLPVTSVVSPGLIGRVEAVWEGSRREAAWVPVDYPIVVPFLLLARPQLQPNVHSILQRRLGEIQ